jgi:dTDP-4-dehydrorhamnose 3,5-epimerase
MIEGVAIKKVKANQDDRGFFAEIVKAGEETYHEIRQTSYSETYPGVIKAFHWHKRQWDIWCVVKGMAQVVLYDLREDSSTKGKTEVLYVGEKDLQVIAIPPGVAHGYRVLSPTPMGILYHTSEAYDPKNPDEGRIAFDDPKIGFNWETRNR